MLPLLESTTKLACISSSLPCVVLSNRTVRHRMAPLQICSVDEVLSIGLKMFGFDEFRQKRQCRQSNVDDFKAHFGAQPIVLAQIWEDLQTTTIAEARIKTSTCQNGMVAILTFLRSNHCLMLMRHPTEREGKGQSGNCKKTFSKRNWCFIQRMQAVREDKVRASCRHDSNDAKKQCSASACADTVHSL